MEFNYKIGSKGLELFAEKDDLIDKRYTIDIDLVEEQVHLAFISPYVDGHIILSKDDTDLDYKIKQELKLPEKISFDEIIGGFCFVLQFESELLVQKIENYTVEDSRLESPLAFSDASKLRFDRYLNPIHESDTLIVTHPIYLNETLLLDEGCELRPHKIEGFFYNRGIFLKLIDSVSGVEVLIPAKSIAIK